MTLRITSLLLAVAALAACGTPGAPLPPSLELPRPVTDLTAVRKGNKVFLSWSPPYLTTDRVNIRRAAVTLVCRGVNDFPMAKCDQQIEQVQLQQAGWKKAEPVPRAEFTDTLPDVLQQLNATGQATYAVEDQNWRGHTAGLSNQVQVPLAPTLPAPENVQAQVTPDGVLLTWNPVSPPAQSSTGLQFSYRLVRRDESAPAEKRTGQKPEVIVGDLPLDPGTSNFVDTAIEWEHRYVYRVSVQTVVSAAEKTFEVSGDDSAPVTVSAHDVFPPPVPGGLQAVFSGTGQKPFIDLTWAPSAVPDLAGYNVYRHEKGEQPVRVSNSLAQTPSFRDEDVQRGHSYIYSVSAVDVRGNESGKSDETSETVPE